VDATAQSESASPSRRIQIGTQRAGVTPPSLAPKYQYIAPPAPRADDAGATAAAGATPALGRRLVWEAFQQGKRAGAQQRAQ
jgi:hypothetical protein